jgi:N-acetylmuramic acid 6-phosphate (MurNAc-6-P) etherase
MDQRNRSDQQIDGTRAQSLLAQMYRHSAKCLSTVIIVIESLDLAVEQRVDCLQRGTRIGLSEGLDVELCQGDRRDVEAP